MTFQEWLKKYKELDVSFAARDALWKLYLECDSPSKKHEKTSIPDWADPEVGMTKIQTQGGGIAHSENKMV